MSSNASYPPVFIPAMNAFDKVFLWYNFQQWCGHIKSIDIAKICTRYKKQPKVTAFIEFDYWYDTPFANYIRSHLISGVTVPLDFQISYRKQVVIDIVRGRKPPLPEIVTPTSSLSVQTDYSVSDNDNDNDSLVNNMSSLDLGSNRTKDNEIENNNSSPVCDEEEAYDSDMDPLSIPRVIDYGKRMIPKNRFKRQQVVRA